MGMTNIEQLRVRFEASLGNPGAAKRGADGRYAFEFVEAAWHEVLGRNGTVGIPGAEFVSMATQAGLCSVIACPIQFFALQHFAGLVAAKEREACAEVCDRGAEQMMHAYKREGAARCASVIRARGEKEGA